MISDFLFLTCLVPRQIEDTVRSKSRSNMQDAANALQWHIYEGLCANLKTPPNVINALPIGSFPQYYRDAFVKRGEFSENSGRIINTGFCNIKLLRKFLLNKSVYKELKKYYKNNTADEKYLCVYTLNSEFLKAIGRLKKHVKGLKVCAVVADLPDMSSLSSKKSFLQKAFGRYLSDKAYSYSECVDGYVLLTRQMADYMKIDKPFCVMEGISTATEEVPKVQSVDERVKTVLYTGTLHKRFGVMTLVEAFAKIPDEDVRLVLCGVGDSEAEIKAAAGRDHRIDFKGQVTRKEALELQAQAAVLVNPRQNNEEFTKYSFPSKNLEYLSSGVPLVAYKLDGIPSEYDGYINYVEDDTPNALAEKLRAILNLSPKERADMGDLARRFVLFEKNSTKQTKKILELFAEL